MNEEKRKFISALFYSGLVIAVLWAVKAIELIFGISFASWGILPLKPEGLPGILFAPLLHADLAHLAANSAPLFLLGAALVYYYRENALKIFIQLWLITGVWVWLVARGSSYHIGASGVVYALATFHFASGLIRREPRVMAFSMLVIFLYGSMVWGIFPDFFPKKNISWESHLMGAIAGLILAFYYRSSGPQRTVYLWEDEDDEDKEAENENKNEAAKITDLPDTVDSTKPGQIINYEIKN